MKAASHGSTPLGRLVGCPACGRKLYLDRRAPGSSVCGGCGATVMQSLRAVAELSFRATAERLFTLCAMLRLERDAARLASQVADERTRARVENVAQYATAQRNLLVQDWHGE